MAYKDFSAGIDADSRPTGTHDASHLTINGQTVELPDASFVKDAHLSRDGMDLVLEGPDGTVVIEGYFSTDPAPNLVAPDGSMLTPDLVESFTTGSPEYASNQTINDASPIGAVQEVNGKATVTHKDGTVENIAIGTPIFEGDVVETDASGAVNIMFVDQTSFAVSEDARLAIDEYVFDASTQSGTTDFSILKGVFVFTSGLIGRDDPDDVKIDTPAGSIGIRGTIIAGNITTGEITVIEGAIVLHDFEGHEVTLASQFDTARFNPSGGGIEHMGQLSANDVSARFSSVSHVSPNLFSNINDTANEQGGQTDGGQDAAPDAPAGEAPQEGPAPGDIQGSDAGTVTVPVPPPVVPMNSTGFGNTSGFAPATLGGTAPPPMGPAPTGGTAGFAPPPPPPPGGIVNGTVAGADGHHPFDPNLPPPPPPSTGPVNHAPFHRPEAPQEFFMSGEGMAWHYHFNKEFGDLDFVNGDSLQFVLDAATIAQLNGLTIGGVSGKNVLSNSQGTGATAGTGDDNMGWSFDGSNGHLQLFFNSGFATTPGAATSITLGISALDLDGVATHASYAFQALDPFAYISGSFANQTIDNYSVIHTGVTGSPVGTIVSSYSTYLFGNANNTVSIDYLNGTDQGDHNLVNLGNGTNSAFIATTAFYNTVIGGDQQDTITLRNAQSKAYGMDGDDTLVLDFANGPSIVSELATSTSNTVIDGGHSNFRAAHVLRNTYGLMATDGEAGGRGDTLQLEGTATLNFSAIDPNNKITGIERLDMQAGAGGQTVFLNYNDVLKLTGPENHHTLLIRLGAGDVLNLVGSEFNIDPLKMHLVVDDAVIDDNATETTGTTGDDTSFDVFSDGNVTLLIHNGGGGAAVNFDGVPVTI